MSFIQDADPDAILSVGADMRKINLCFMLLKVSSQIPLLTTEVNTQIIIPIQGVCLIDRIVMDII